MIIVGFIIIAAIIFFIQSILYDRYALQHIEYDRKFKQKTVYAGEQLELVEKISNYKWLPVPWLRVESLLSTHIHFGQLDNLSVSKGQVYQNHKSLFTLKPYVEITRRHRLTAAKRGVYKLDTVTITSGDLLGWKTRHKRIPLSGELIVYPKPADVSLDQIPFHSMQGDHTVSRWINPDPFQVAGVRQYQPGDTLRSINWKATARTGELQVHKHDFTANRILMIYLNVDDHEGMWHAVGNEELIEQGISWAAGAAASVIEAGMDVGFSSNMSVTGSTDSIYVQPGSGFDHLLYLYEAMARLMLVKIEPFSNVLKAADVGQDILIISSYWNEELEIEASHMRQKGNSVTIWPLMEGVQA